MTAIAKQLASRIKEKGGRAFYVGGCVRDELLGIDNKDVDIEVFGIAQEELLTILSEFGEVLQFGSSFGIYALKDYPLDIALPRKEVRTGSGHRDFMIVADPFISYQEAARRRDITINALMKDVLSGEIIDNYGGLADLHNRVIRQVAADTFVEDPLRVLRVAQFAARLEFTIARETIELCQSVDLRTLSKERVEEELKKALLRSRRPSLFFMALRQMQQLDYWFQEIKELIGLAQDQIYHPEGDVFQHTMMVLDAGVAYLQEVSDPYHFLLLCLCHDLGKIVCSEEINGRIHAYGHETKGQELVENFIGRFSNSRSLKKYLLNMVPLHMKANALAFNKSAIKKTNAFFDSALCPKDLLYFAFCDRPLQMNGQDFKDDGIFLFERYALYEEMMKEPGVSGKDLLANGLKEDVMFKDYLAYAHKLKLAGLKKDEALKQTLAYIRKKKKIVT